MPVFDVPLFQLIFLSSFCFGAGWSLHKSNTTKLKSQVEKLKQDNMRAYSGRGNNVRFR